MLVNLYQNEKLCAVVRHHLSSLLEMQTKKY